MRRGFRHGSRAFAVAVAREGTFGGFNIFCRLGCHFSRWIVGEVTAENIFGLGVLAILQVVLPNPVQAELGAQLFIFLKQV